MSFFKNKKLKKKFMLKGTITSIQFSTNTIISNFHIDKDFRMANKPFTTQNKYIKRFDIL